MSYLRSDLHTRVDAIQEALAAAPTPDDREQLKQQIAALFRDAEAASIEARAMKDGVTALIDRWKQLDRAAAPVATAPSARIDHLGASTFIEKGWSKLSLDDAAGAELAFCRALELAPGGNEAETLLGWAASTARKGRDGRPACKKRSSSPARTRSARRATSDT